MTTTIVERQQKEKALLIEQLRKVPIIHVACEKVGVGRATYYRWRTDDADFKKHSDESIKEGELLVNDMAESQLLTAIRNQNLTAIIFWLKHHHPTYSTRVELTARIKHDEQLTPEQEELVTKALKHTLFISDKTNL